MSKPGGRPLLGDRRLSGFIGVRLGEDEREKLAAIAEQEGKSISLLVREIIVSHVETEE